MTDKSSKNIAIAGCGIAGCFLGILLSKKGHKVSIYEKLSEKESINTASKRSFNITFFGYGLKLLQEAGLWDKILPFTTKLSGSTTYLSKSKNPIVSKNRRGSSPYYSVSRSDILKVLIREAKLNKVNIEFDTPLEGINKTKRTLSVKNLKNKKIKELKVDMVIGCDGVNSVVRESLISETGSRIVKVLAEWTYKQIVISHNNAKNLGIKYNYANTWSDKNFAIVAFPNKDKTHTAIVITKGINNLDFSYITKKFPSLQVLKKEFDALQKVKPGRFATLHTTPWFYNNFIVIMGDAAHAFNPFFGQGVSAAFGDAYLLSELIEKENGLEIFQKKRKVHMDALGELSKKGFKRYRRERRADYNSVYEKIESVLYQKFPSIFVRPIFDSITIDPGFSNNYIKAHTRQRRILAFLAIPVIARIITSIYSSLEERKLIII